MVRAGTVAGRREGNGMTESVTLDELADNVFEPVPEVKPGKKGNGVKKATKKGSKE
jgi:hypothetical protein